MSTTPMELEVLEARITATQGRLAEVQKEGDRLLAQLAGDVAAAESLRRLRRRDGTPGVVRPRQ